MRLLLQHKAAASSRAFTCRCCLCQLLLPRNLLLLLLHSPSCGHACTTIQNLRLLSGLLCRWLQGITRCPSCSSSSCTLCTSMLLLLGLACVVGGTILATRLSPLGVPKVEGALSLLGTSSGAPSSGHTSGSRRRRGRPPEALLLQVVLLRLRRLPRGLCWFNSSLLLLRLLLRHGCVGEPLLGRLVVRLTAAPLLLLLLLLLTLLLLWRVLGLLLLAVHRAPSSCCCSHLQWAPARRPSPDPQLPCRAVPGRGLVEGDTGVTRLGVASCSSKGRGHDARGWLEWALAAGALRQAATGTSTDTSSSGSRRRGPGKPWRCL